MSYGNLQSKDITYNEQVTEVIFQWFGDSPFQGNMNNCHVLLSIDKQVQVNISH